MPSQNNKQPFESALVSALQASAQHNANSVLAAIAASQNSASSMPVTAAPSVSTQATAANANTALTNLGNSNICNACGATIQSAQEVCYVVFVGHATGVYDSFPLVHLLTNKCSGNSWHQFDSCQEAETAFAEAERLGLTHVVDH
ncbi:hypothetical protein GYMLUDRAFT_244819 [Collybiopsis luxurians FD-317 M1]|uniref:Ribonuclease H1 N-terminal domain-containing protein n=1 Tax=Collybiopsis luxurians FD-317 M1 TaxID=944289 RepID=A0A0D0B910_9AGAR|nr:hypothetical protein GYMLUDRAFT_244819 [Collybiopsis luxurians FD-317 M1]